MVQNKEKLEEKKAQLMQLSMSFCKEYLNEEYAVVIEKLVNKMARKREVPFMTGRIEIWAAAVIHALGTINFLFDKASLPYVTASDIFDFFNTKQSTTSQKSKKIRDMFNMFYFDSEFSTKRNNEHSPLNGLTMVNGFIVPEDLIQEQTVEKELLDEWELKIADILGVSKVRKEKKYSEEEKYDLLEVTYESLNSYYKYIEQHLEFPFLASIEQETGPLEVTEFEVNCVKFGQEIVVDEFYGIIVECTHGRKTVAVPLAEIDLSEEHHNFPFIDAYQDWFWNYR